MADLATAYLLLVPSLKGAQKTIEDQLGGIGDKAGEKAGEGLGEGILGSIGDVAKKAAGIFAAAFTAKKVFDFGKQAFDAYADFEQASGGIEKLYGDAYGTVMENADTAWASMGLSANEYLSTVTSISSALINDLGGNTAKAANMADKAMESMADNASIYGTDMETLQNAYKNFARGNYSMLDSLNLGYGQSKEEMERLIADANEYAESIGQAGDLTIDSFADVVTAIDLVQQKQHIAGNAADEAAKTISGSVNATKAAWRNLVLELGRPDANIGLKIRDMLEAVFGTGDGTGLLANVTKEVGVIARNMISGLGTALGMGVDWLLSNAPALADKAIAGVKDLLSRAFDAVKGFRFGGALDLFDGLFAEDSLGAKVLDMLSQVGAKVMEAAPGIAAQVSGIWNQIVATAQVWGPIFLTKIGELASSVAQYVLANGPQLVASVASLVMQLLASLSERGPEIVAKVGELLTSVRDWLIANWPMIQEAIATMLSGLVDAIVTYGPTILTNIATMIGQVIGYVISAAADMLAAGIQWVAGLVEGSRQEGETLLEWFMGLGGEVIAAIGDATMWLVDVGAQIVQGLISGIQGSIGGVADVLLSGLQDAIDAVLGLFVIGSPSRLFAWIGEMNMQGLSGGIEDSAKMAVSATQDAVSGVYDAAVGGSVSMLQKSMGAAISDAYKAQPLVAAQRPVGAPAQAGGWSEVAAGIDGLRGDMGSLGIYLDGKTLVGGIAPRMDRALVM